MCGCVFFFSARYRDESNLGLLEGDFHKDFWSYQVLSQSEWSVPANRENRLGGKKKSQTNSTVRLAFSQEVIRVKVI